MKKIYQEQVEIANKLNSDSEKLLYLTSILRSLLQLCVVSSFEVAAILTPVDEIDLSNFTERFCKPSDGLPIEILDRLTPIFRSYHDRYFLTGWFEIIKKYDHPLSKQLTEWAQFRNKRTGHGVLDIPTTTLWATKTSKIIIQCIDTLGDLIPIVKLDGSIALSKALNNIEINIPVHRDNHAIVINEITMKKGIWKLKGQLLSLTESHEFTTTLPDNNVFLIKNIKSINEYKLHEITSKNKEYLFFHNIPIRQTDIFEGRENEITEIIEWINDEDSRWCLVFGDGGYGKTTLVLETLNRLIESQFDLNEPIPTLICYHTAKMTKWTEDGLIHFRSTQPVIDECIRELIRFFNPILTPDWYKTEGNQLIDKAVTVLHENKHSRDDVLLVIDNTEALATTVDEVKDLASHINIIGRRIGRVIITSRRREFIQATPIEVVGLSEAESANLLKRLSKEYNADAIVKAGDSKLRNISRQLMHKPLLLEALVKYIARAKIGIDQALDNVFKRSNQDLLEFLYEDAWARMNALQKEVIMIIINLTSPLNQMSISQTCQEVGIQHSEFHLSLEETHFTVLTDYGKKYTLEFVELAYRFFQQQLSKFPDSERERIRITAEKIDKYMLEREKIEEAYITDRVAEAFRNEYAKAAKVYADKGQISDAIEMYKLAIIDDPLNSSLHDRFSWLLLNRTVLYGDALALSLRAFELDENNCDAIVGLALVNYRIGNISEGDKYIDLAEKKGRTKSFCLLRKSIARFHKVKSITYLDVKKELLEEAVVNLELAKKLNRNKSYDAKILDDIDKYYYSSLKALDTVKRAITKK